MATPPAERSSREKKNRVRRLRALLRPWPRLVAEMFGVRRPDAPRAASGAVPSETEWEAIRFGAFWFGHASVMLRVPMPSEPTGGVTVYADPNFREHAGGSVLGRPLGRRRSTELPEEMHLAPHPDIILLSHAHLDHWDRDALRWLASISDRHTTAVIPVGTRRLLPAGFSNVLEIRWGEVRHVHGLAIRAIEPRHWGARAVWDRHRGYNAYTIEGAGTRVVFAGDTAVTHAFDHLRESGGVDLAVLPIGNYYEPWENQHCTPEQAADMARRMGARLVLGMHHATFRDKTEPIDEPLERFIESWGESGVVCKRVGEQWADEFPETS